MTQRGVHARGLCRQRLRESVYVCPCHGSEFNTSGVVVQGPATAPLRQFPTTFANNVVTISV
jgi:cytochrome b6-f complex iron-sulfur subunit